MASMKLAEPTQAAKHAGKQEEEEEEKEDKLHYPLCDYNSEKSINKSRVFVLNDVLIGPPGSLLRCYNK